MLDCRGLRAEDPDLRGVKGEILLIRNPEFALSRPLRLMHPRYPLYIVPRGDGVFMIGATIIESAESQSVSIHSAMSLMSALYTLHPSFGDAEIIEITAGIRPAYPDNLPRVTWDGHVARCNGLYRHGYLLAPALAEYVAARLDGRDHPYHVLLSGEKFHAPTTRTNYRQRRA